MYHLFKEEPAVTEWNKVSAEQQENIHETLSSESDCAQIHVLKLCTLTSNMSYLPSEKRFGH